MDEIIVIPRNRVDELGEGLLWSPREQALFWTDIIGKRLNRLDPAQGSVQSWPMPDYLAWVIERSGGGLVAGLGLSIVALGEEAQVEAVLANMPEAPGNLRLNDAKADSTGRIWAGTMPVAADLPLGAFYRIDPVSGVVLIESDYTIANGPAISPCGNFLLHTDTALRTLFRYDLRDDGQVDQRRPHIIFADDWGSPDGMTFDGDNCLWVACWGSGRVMRFSPEGAVERIVRLPASQITNCTFAGPSFDRMFVTSASIGVAEPLGGCLFEIDPGCAGYAPDQYAG